MGRGEKTAAKDAKLRQRAAAKLGDRLTEALRNGKTSGLAELVASGADPNHADRGGETPLSTVLKYGPQNAEAVKTLLALGADPNLKTGYGVEPILIAALRKHVDSAQVLLDAGVSRESLLRAHQCALLHEAAVIGDAAAASRALADGADLDGVDKDGWTAFHTAVGQGPASEGVARLLLERGADPAIRCLDGRDALGAASTRGAAELVREILSRGVDPDGSDYRQTTPLHRAAHNARHEVVDFLLGHGADPGRANDEGETPLHLAAKEGCPRCSLLLLRAGADPNAADRRQSAPLHRAAHNARHEVVAALLEHGADPNLPNEWGETPLHLAAAAGCPHCSLLLLRAGADPDAETRLGETPGQIALRERHADTIAAFASFAEQRSLHEAAGSARTAARPRV